MIVSGSGAGADDSENLKKIIALGERGQWTEARQQADHSGQIVRAIYEWLVLQRSGESYPFERYRAFLLSNGDWPFARRIRANAEQGMVAGMPATETINFYRETDPVSARGMILLARAYQAQGQAQGQGDMARARVAKWFIEAGLVDDEQAMILNALGDEISDDVKGRRLDRLINTGQYTQAKAIARDLGEDVEKLADARMALARGDRGAERLSQQVPLAYRNDPGLVYERLKWRRRKDEFEDMSDLILRLPSDFRPYDSRAFSSEQQIAVQGLMNEKDFIKAYQTAVHINHDDRFARAQVDWQAGFIALTYLKQPGRAFRHFETLYKSSLSPLSRARAAYWAGESSLQLGYPDVARAWYRTASAYRGNFYGQLAATKIPPGAEPYRRGPPLASLKEQQEFARNPMVRAVRLLHDAGADKWDVVFLGRIAGVYKGNGPMLRLVVDLANDLKRTTDAVKISREAAMSGVDFSDYVFPTLPGLTFDGVEPALIYAIIRQESAFDPDAVSGSGARGLMQLMPQTAKTIAHREGQKHKVDWLTERPKHNVSIGTAYLRELVRKYQSYALVAAAYNAGETRVDGWLRKYGDPRAGQIGLIEWIERIPVYETRNYTQRVLEGTFVYRRKLDKAISVNADSLHLGR